MIWIIGNQGMLGKELSRYFDKAGLSHVGSDREVSILDPSALGRFANRHTPDWIVNCSAYTAVDKAEEEESSAFALNRDGPANIAEAAADLNVPLIHISTDYVFDGSSAEPLAEDAATGPQSVYGKSKLAGEEAVRKITQRHCIIRTAWLYGEFGSNFVYTMLKLMESRSSIKVVDDQKGSPTWTRELARLIAFIVGSKSTAYGTYHFSGEGECSWYAFAREIYRLGREKGVLTSVCEIIPCLSSEFPTPARRPRYSLLSKEKVKRAFGIEIPDWRDSLADFFTTADIPLNAV
ncbi:dTDP-4-dehydrorhamnose reductase [Marispirochaeta aestuarii]|uniref:dTDP-4-dehydrorhamnose reductase n=1 Tax=Marispirochaeta aestuarii TaxID=1963862 RepID=UPI0029C91383|nr:dTDP-4-dehydrorhamnose reductase [Marispirochaeta aestuarii]